VILAALEAALAGHGLLLRGAFHPTPEDAVPPLTDGNAAGTIMLVGNAGRGLWDAFAGSLEAQDDQPHPLDRWTRRVLEGLAGSFGATSLFPFGGPPYLPFQRWAMRAEPVHPSPLGMLIHPTYGLWHAYRGALALSECLALPPRGDLPRPCDSCAGRPCMTACPVDAFTPAGYAVDRCRDYLSTPEGEPCMVLACRARTACPVGRDYAYAPAQALFHMRAFRGGAGSAPPRR
jgi:hypothetical protein